jgi:hypothetical protein
VTIPQRVVPDPEVQPTMPVWPDTGEILGLSRQSAYGAARRGEIPTLRIGRRLVVPTAKLRQLLGLDDGGESDVPAA